MHSIAQGIVMQAAAHELLSHCFAETEVGKALNLANTIDINSCFVAESSLETMRFDKGE